MKEKRFLKRYEILILIGVLLFGFFYWHGVRQQDSTKSDCSRIADEKVARTRFYGFDEGAEKARDYSAYYEQCLQKEGL